MKIGVLGLGAIAPFFLRAIEQDPQVTLAAVCDRDREKILPFTERGVPGFDSVEALLDAGHVDALVITLPNNLHADVAVQALERGIAVCCEKPLTVTSTDADRVVAAARRGKATLFTAFHRRYNRNLHNLAAQLPKNPAEITLVRARYHENITEHTGGDQWYLDPLRCGGGCLIDNGPNALDTVRFLVGDLRVVDATIGDVRTGCEHYAEVALEGANGVPVQVELDWALPTGELKDVTVETRDGRLLRADMLGGFEEFKSSLDHEYVGILADFRRAVALGTDHVDAGPEIVRLVSDAYTIARRKETRARMTAKNAVVARVVKLLFHSRAERGMSMSPWLSRCVPAGQIHELVTTTDRPTRPGDRVDRVGFLGFAEFHDPAVVERGDEVWLGDGRRIGVVAGFDECHAPNHYNILIDTERLLTAADLDLRPGDQICFRATTGE
ncbi:hypothetical protein GCM10012275_59030 [Longimycelium tulufanense]|uniref:Uncharacterized protein n=1 Tax=Longimycelium tulufanense TaxID=907463 RepID=A0A8J3FYB0_9PSEU|nr:Gfo/Idh/MocA family oxidoreductase [Longimycelium tulufanense]GGM80569.1 hypothetical protein GCM10012275_59030 [Longimycelium tulufanense]